MAISPVRWRRSGCRASPGVSPLPASAVRFELVSLTDPTDNVVLRAPDFGNKDRLGFNRVLRETRGGTLIVFADPEWPKTQTLALNFSGLTQAEAGASCLPGESPLIDGRHDQLGRAVMDRDRDEP